MPCNSDFPTYKQNEYEKHISKTVKHLMYIYSLKNAQPPAELVAAYTRCQFSEVEGDKWVSKLCSVLKGMSKTDFDTLLYNSKSKKAQAVIEWWDEHQKKDKQRK